MMRREVRAGMLLAFCAALPACSNGGKTSSPAPVSGDEQQAVADAEEMLDERLPEPDLEAAPTLTPDGN